MIISRIVKSDIVYYQLHAEQAVTATYIDEEGSGIFEEVLTLNTLERIVDDFKSFPGYNLILDCQNLKSCQNNLKKKIKDFKDIAKSVVLTNAQKEIVEKLDLAIFSNPNNVEDGERFLCFYVSDKDDFAITNTTLFDDAFKESLIRYSTSDGEDPIYHESSSVYLSNYINIKKMISLDKNLFIYAIYKLAIKINEHWFKELNIKKPTLICQNLNSSYVASILSGFLKLDVLILDKLGPINKLYSTLDNKIKENESYLVVSDVVCLGTEMKIAKNLITFLGGHYLGNVSIIRVETLLSETKKFNDTECVFTITRENNPTNFQILTALNLVPNE